jgi:hypothetical protein
MKILSSAICFLLFSAVALAQQPSPDAAKPAASKAPAAAAEGPEITPSPAHPITLEQTRKMFELMNFQKSMDGMMNQIIASQDQQAPFIPTAVWDDFRSSFQSTDFVALFLPVYQKYISTEDAAKSLEFYETPAGHHMLQVMPPMMSDIYKLAGQKGQEIGQAVVQRHMAEIQAAAKKYQEDHAAPSAPASAPPASSDKPASPK